MDSMTAEDDSWVVVRTVAYPHEAHLMRSILAGHGIDAVVPEPYFIGVQPGLSLAAGGVRVLVRQIDAAAAAELLSGFTTANTIGAPWVG